MTTPPEADCHLDADWLPGLHVPSGYQAIRDLIPPGASVLVSTLDSSRDLRGARRLLEQLRAAGFDPAFLGSGLVLTATEVAELVEDASFFAGFDEIWVFPHTPVSPLPTTAVLTSERPVEVSDELARWLCSAGCLVGLGDGDGLNFATTEPEVAARLRAAAK